MTRLPEVGGDSGSWGEILNDFLAQSHADDGSLKNDTVGTTQLRPSAITAAALADGSVTNSKIADGAVGTVQLADSSVSRAKLLDAGTANGIATLGSDGRLPEAQVPSRLAEDQLSATIGVVAEPLIEAAIADIDALRVEAVANGALLVSGTNVALCGDSITAGAGSTNVTVDSYAAYLGKIIGTARVNVVNHGVGGDTAGGLLARMPAIVAANPAAIVLQIGTNASASLAAYKTAYLAILDLIRDARIPVLINLLPPRGAATSAEVERTNTYNLFIRSVAMSRGLPLTDAFTALVDPATGYLQAAYDADGTHPLPGGHLALAKAVAAKLDALLPVKPPYVSGPGAPGLIANPIMSGGTVSTAPTGWTSGGTTGAGTVTVGTEDPVPGDGLTAGKWLKLSIDNSTSGSSTTASRYHNLGSAPAAGDVILITAKIKNIAGSEDRAVLQWRNGATVLGQIIAMIGVTNPGMIARAYTVASVPANPRIYFNVTAQANTIRTCYVGEVQVFNLTQLGLLELVP